MVSSAALGFASKRFEVKRTADEEILVADAKLPPADLGDLAAMAATLPGVQLVPGQNGDASGYSVLGLGADQNNTTLNGMSFGGSNLPRDAGVSNFIMRGMSLVR
jgi:hypothetical protein